MYVVERVARGHRYLHLVESVREGKTVRQRTIKALGRKDVLAASGELDRLAASIARHAERSIILSDIDAGRIAARRIGGPLLFGRLWQRTLRRRARSGPMVKSCWREGVDSSRLKPLRFRATMPWRRFLLQSRRRQSHVRAAPFGCREPCPMQCRRSFHRRRPRPASRSRSSRPAPIGRRTRR